jgi:hypothetical protein
MKNWEYWHHLKVFVLAMPFLKLATSNAKVSLGLQPMSIKFTQSSIQTYITWFKKSKKGKVEWTKACLVASL